MKRPQALYWLYLHVLRLCRKAFPARAFSPPFGQGFLANRLVFPVYVHARRLVFALIGRRMRTLAVGDSHIAERVVPHQIWQVTAIARQRTERIMRLLPSVGGLDMRRAKVLCIGPRNEAEVLLLRCYGFRPENVTAIDLFTYSPSIQLMDMHSLKFRDDSFDVVYCAFTLRYSSDPARAVREMVRCARPGALTVIVFIKPVNARMRPGGVSAHAKFENGLNDVLALFGPAVGTMLWREEWERPGPDGAPDAVVCSMIFRVSKDTPEIEARALP